MHSEQKNEGHTSRLRSIASHLAVAAIASVLSASFAIGSQAKQIKALSESEMWSGHRAESLKRVRTIREAQISEAIEILDADALEFSGRISPAIGSYYLMDLDDCLEEIQATSTKLSELDWKLTMARTQIRRASDVLEKKLPGEYDLGE